MRRIGPAGGTLSAVALLSLVVMTGCSEGGGVRVEGDAPAAVVPSLAPSPTGGDRIDPVSVLRHDPKVGADIKAALKPCGGDEYPVDTSYGDLTGGSRPDVVINVSTCGDGVGLGGYVYRVENGRYVDVFGDDTPPVYIDISQGDLELTRQIYSHRDAVCCPSGEDVYMYHWSNGRFTETSQTRNEYGTSGDD
ncbi:hypothetical protein POF50_010085 [Streptomyces sp. SL13]|uniref:Lipoprotein CseA n=1 Tax=Streptantibioticus silvisoli TaxID=2705255 RepID=A0AA90H855_9ACTN|nr:hypothetical protein [Streptantibioticus silvisoli]MDI5962854.1 hypothetical protein [Streptantibioticus silvisoli]MDI5969682.1 hypothetical protein [Streptantibioticus silvisoli]